MSEKHRPLHTGKKNLWPFILWPLLAMLLTVVFLSPNFSNAWVNWDDPAYVLNNALIKELSAARVTELFTTLQVQGIYHPLTLLSLSLDYAISGTSPVAYHMTNMLLHLFNILLVFWLMYVLFGRLDLSFFTALLFGMHPLHVETVAWISARKDLLSGMFFLAGLVSYVYYLNKAKTSWMRYLLCVFFFILALLSKTTAVTFPLVLLLIDYLKERKDLKKIILEKIPLLSLSMVFGLVAIKAQQEVAALSAIQQHAFHKTIFIGFYGIVNYLIKAFVPFQLSPYHPYPDLANGDADWYIYAASIPFLLVLLATIYSMRKSRKIAFGMGFFMLPLLPVLQVLPVGGAIMAERYTYISYIGLFYLLWLFMNHLLEKRKGQKAYLYMSFALAGVYVLWLGMLSWKRSTIWENGYTMWSDVIEKYPRNFLAYNNRGSYFIDEEAYEKALDDFNQSILLNPHNADSYNNRAMIFRELGQYEQALADFTKAIGLNENYLMAYINRAVLSMRMGNREQALSDLSRALVLDPNNKLAFLNKGVLMLQAGQTKEALENFSQAIRVAPNQADGWYYRGLAYAVQKDFNAALKDLDQSLVLDPAYAEGFFRRSQVYNDLGQSDKAFRDAQKARELGYPVPEAYFNSLKE